VPLVLLVEVVLVVLVAEYEVQPPRNQDLPALVVPLVVAVVPLVAVLLPVLMGLSLLALLAHQDDL
jgi:hypothetical protein